MHHSLAGKFETGPYRLIRIAIPLTHGKKEIFPKMRKKESAADEFTPPDFGGEAAKIGWGDGLIDIELGATVG